MLKKIGIAFSLVMLLLFASVGANSMFKTLQVNIIPMNFYFDGKQAIEDKPGYYFNGVKEVPLALAYEGTTYLPIRYISEKLEKEIGWDQASRSVWVGQKPTSFSTTLVENRRQNSLFGIYVGQSEQEVTQLLGKPNRVDKGEQGYDWWIYNQDYSRYIQVGIKNSQVVDLYTNSTDLSFAKELKIGSTKEQLRNAYLLNSTVKVEYDRADIAITNDLVERPLVLIDGVLYMFYLDLHDQDKVTAIRSLSIETFVKSGLYEFTYTYIGKKPDFSVPKLSASEQNIVSQAYEKQVFDLTNSIRKRHNLVLLTWNEDAANVARGHSLDMLENDFFDHISATSGHELSDRISEYGIDYERIGENIAMGYNDSIEAHEAWMNSKGHRSNILENSFKTLGVGVKAHYYTQNFVTYR